MPRARREEVGLKTKGALLWGAGKEWSIEEIEVGDPREGEVTVQLAASGLCHSDEHLVTGAMPVAFYPVIGGHEGSGIVTRVGPGVTGLQEGDHVVTAFIPACGHCEPCSSGMQNLCDLGADLLTGRSISDGTSRVRTSSGQDVVQMCLLGTFSPYITVHQASVVKIAPEIPLEVAALVGCGVTTGWGSATQVGRRPSRRGRRRDGRRRRRHERRPGRRRRRRQAGVRGRPESRKREWAMDFGATHAFASVEEAAESISVLTWGRMASKVIITVGNIQGEDVAAAQS